MRLLLCFFVLFLGWIFENVMFVLGVYFLIRKKQIEVSRRDYLSLGLSLCFLGIVFCRQCVYVDKWGNYIPQTLFYEALFLIFVMIGWSDQKKKIIANELNLCLLILGLVGMAAGIPAHVELWARLAGMLIISVPVLCINRYYPGGFGNGDVKFFAAAGFALGWKLLFQGVIIGSFFAAIGAVFLLVSHKIERKGSIAFGPYLCAGIIVNILEYLQIFFV